MAGGGLRRSSCAPGGAAGFTLLEMVTVLVIAAILYFVALPGYQHAVLKSGRAAARGILLEVMTRQEEYFINHKHYAVALAELGLPQPLYINRQAEAVEQARAAYQVDLVLEDEVFVGVAAAPRNRQAEDGDCMAFSLSRTGIRAVSGSFAGEPGHCWQ
jgi:type IV pilus assembly protein PilE